MAEEKVADLDRPDEGIEVESRRRITGADGQRRGLPDDRRADDDQVGWRRYGGFCCADTGS